MVAVWTLKVSAISLTDLPLVYEPAHQVCLLGVEFSRAPEAPPSGRLPASAGTFPDQVAFKLSNACKHGHDQLASVTSGL